MEAKEKENPYTSEYGAFEIFVACFLFVFEVVVVFLASVFLLAVSVYCSALPHARVRISVRARPTRRRLVVCPGKRGFFFMPIFSRSTTNRCTSMGRRVGQQRIIKALSPAGLLWGVWVEE